MKTKKIKDTVLPLAAKTVEKKPSIHDYLVLYVFPIASFFLIYWGQLSQPSLTSLFRLVTIIVIVFLPLILYMLVVKEEILKNKVKTKNALWVGVFILFPIAFSLLGIEINDLPFCNGLIKPSPFNQHGILWHFLACLFTQELLFAGFFMKKNDVKKSKGDWVKFAFRLIFYFSFIGIFMSDPFQVKLEDFSGMECFGFYLVSAIQIFLAYSIFYLIYHIHHQYLFNHLLKKKKIFRYFFGSIILIGFTTLAEDDWRSTFPAVLDFQMHPAGFFPKIFGELEFSAYNFHVWYSLPFIFIYEWNRQMGTINLLEKEKTETELTLLKQQINPHFFFNTLNNLYSMSLTQEKETPATILRLSQLMRYVIYKGKEEWVPLIEEVEYLNDYINLQKIRLHNHLDLKFEIEIKEENLKVSPLLFIILVENAFKHGIEPAEEDCFLHLDLYADQHIINFVCYNSKEEEPEEEKKSGIGLENLRHRLALLYPVHRLEIHETLSDYEATLTIEL